MDHFRAKVVLLPRFRSIWNADGLEPTNGAEQTYASSENDLQQYLSGRVDIVCPGVDGGNGKGGNDGRVNCPNGNKGATKGTMIADHVGNAVNHDYNVLSVLQSEQGL